MQTERVCVGLGVGWWLVWGAIWILIIDQLYTQTFNQTYCVVCIFNVVLFMICRYHWRLVYLNDKLNFHQTWNILVIFWRSISILYDMYFDYLFYFLITVGSFKMSGAKKWAKAWLWPITRECNLLVQMTTLFSFWRESVIDEHLKVIKWNKIIQVLEHRLPWQYGGPLIWCLIWLKLPVDEGYGEMEFRWKLNWKVENKRI